MSEETARRIRKIDFLKSVGTNPDRKIEEIGKELGVSRTGSYNYLQEFVENAVMTDNEPDFPRKLLMFYNKDIPDNEEKLEPPDVEQLRFMIEDYYQKHLPKHEETLNTEEQSNRTMSTYNNPSVEQWARTDRSTDTGLLRTLLLNAKIVHPSVIDRFLEQYEINRENFNKNPLSLLEYMKHVFSNAQGEQIWKIFQESRGKYVYGADGQQKMGMDPMMMAMMMGGGGGFNPAMIPMMMGQGGGDSSAVMNAIMMQQMQQEAARKQAKQDQAEQFERITQTLMLKMVGGSIDDKKPMYDMMGGGMMGGMMGPPTMREVLDEGGRVKARDYIPNFQGMGQHPPGSDPMSIMMIGKLMDANTQLMMKSSDTGNVPMQILNTMIPFFKNQGDPGTQLAAMIDTVNKVAPGFFEHRNEPQGGLEVYKLKFDTELAMQAQKIEMAKMEHMWDIDKMDKQASADNAKNWLGMIGTFGDKIVSTVGPAIVDGFGQKMLGKQGAQAQQQPQYTPEQMAAIVRARQMQAQQQQQEQQAQQQMQQPAPAQVAQPSQDMSTIYLITNLQNALNQSEKDKQMLIQRLNEQQPAQPHQTNYSIDEKRLTQMPNGQLQEILQELNMQNQGQGELKSKIEAVIANRQLMDSQPTEARQEEERADTPDERSFNTGNAEAEQASSEQTQGEEEHAA